MSNPNPIRALFISLATIAVLALGGCGGTGTEGVSPGDGPAASEPETTTPVEGGGGPTDEPTEEPTEEQAPANFHEKYTYRDGLQVEVIRIKLGHYTRAEIENGYADKKEKPGDPYAQFTVRIRNGSKKTVQLIQSATVTYGPDGVEAKSSHVLDDADLGGKLIPGKSRSATAAWLIPEKWYGDVVMEISPDIDHSSAVFSGSIK
jgi:hypothetical protein